MFETDRWQGLKPKPSSDRFGDTHWDFKTVEYALGEPPKDQREMWQFTRGSKS